jgi:hypothetical protein
VAYLPQPSHIKEIALTINHGISTDMYPHRFDCFVGTYCNTTRVVFQVCMSISSSGSDRRNADCMLLVEHSHSSLLQWNQARIPDCSNTFDALFDAVRLLW